MKFLSGIMVLFLLLGSTVFSQILVLDMSKIDNNSTLNKYESDFLNHYLKDERKQFEFTDKRIIFVTGSTGNEIRSKIDYFNEIDNWNKKYNRKIATSLYIFNDEENEESGGYDAILTYWVKTVPNKQKIIKKVKYGQAGTK